MIRLIALILALILISAPANGLAAQSSSQHTVTQRALSGDITPPTTPGPLVASEVLSNQISLTWGPSTDNYYVSGYQVFRDAVNIATTSLTTYTDFGLTPSTTYSYYIVAFDNDNNFSSSSNSVSTSTIQTQTSGRLLKVGLLALYIEPSIYSANFTWETDRYARYELRWGETASYELGFVTSQTYSRNHQTILTGLESNTTYEYELIAHDRAGNKVVLSRDQFTTLAEPDTVPPPNILRFKAVKDDGDVILTWENPSTDFKYVRIVRNPIFYPTDPNDGFVIHQGTGKKYVDRGILNTYGAIYYTAFSYDESGNRSSGATAFVTRDQSGGGFAFQTDQTTGTSTGTTSDPLSISIDDVTILQSGELIYPKDGNFIVDTTIPFTISAPYEIFPEHLKAIQVTISHPVDNSISYSYLLRINKDKTAYEATIDELGFYGTIPLRLSVYDYQTAESAVAEGALIARKLEPVIEFVRNVAPWYSEFLFPLILVLLLLLIWWLIAKKRKKDEDNPPVRFA